MIQMKDITRCLLFGLLCVTVPGCDFSCKADTNGEISEAIDEAGDELEEAFEGDGQ